MLSTSENESLRISGAQDFSNLKRLRETKSTSSITGTFLWQFFHLKTISLRGHTIIGKDMV
jgi:hypothetical protein